MELHHRNKSNICVVSIKGNLTFDRVYNVKEYFNPFLKDLVSDEFLS